MTLETQITTELALGPNGLDVPLSGGSAYFNYFWLRDADPASIDPVTRERIYDMAEAEAAPRPCAAWIEAEALALSWEGEAHVSRIPLALLEPVVTAGRVADPADLPRRLWRAEAHEGFLRVPQRAVEGEPAARARLARALIEDGVA
ncbi:MAG: gamma-butyrobetaine,2-oxoglutarate dioxygenase, partial [Pseudomonadota bacterium]